MTGAAAVVARFEKILKKSLKELNFGLKSAVQNSRGKEICMLRFMSKVLIAKQFEIQDKEKKGKENERR